MQKLLTTTLLMLALISFSFAQNVASEFYLMKNQKDAEYVLKALNLELRLSESQFSKVKDLLVTSAKSQEEQLQSLPEAEKLNIIKTRQTAHIENNLKAIVGLDKYNIYVSKKPAIEAKLKELKKD